MGHFDPPPGDGGAVQAAATTLGHLGTDLQGDVGSVKNGVTTALADWQAKRADDFRSATFGIQAELAFTKDAADGVAGILGQFAQAWHAAAAEVASQQAAATRAQNDLDELKRKREQGVDVSIWDTVVAEGHLLVAEGKADSVKSDLDTLAGKLAAAIDAYTDKVVPGSSSLTPGEIRRQVDFAMGVSGLRGAGPHGSLTTAQAWTLMGWAALPGQQLLDVIEDNPDGERAGGPVTWLTTDVTVLQDLVDAARADGIAPSRYAALLHQYWVARAAQQAGIDLNAWDPSKGTGANRSTISAVYTFYGNLYLSDPNLQWTGMANMIGPSFAAGFLDLDALRGAAKDLAGSVNDVPSWARGLLPPPLVGLAEIGNLSADEFRFYEDKFLAMQKHIFFDQGAMHVAYTQGGMAAINEMYAAGLIDSKADTAWGNINSGVPDLVTAGNVALLDREQNQIIANQYDQMRNHDGPVGEAMTYLMTVLGSASIPGTKTPGEYRPLTISGSATVPGPFWPVSHETVGVKITTPLPDFNISDRADRWDYVLNDTLPAYQALLRDHPDEARAIIGSSIDDRIDQQRLANRWPQLVENGITDWDISVNGGIGWGPW